MFPFTPFEEMSFTASTILRTACAETELNNLLTIMILTLQYVTFYGRGQLISIAETEYVVRNLKRNMRGRPLHNCIKSFDSLPSHFINFTY